MRLGQNWVKQRDNDSQSARKSTSKHLNPTETLLEAPETAGCKLIPKTVKKKGPKFLHNDVRD